MEKKINRTNLMCGKGLFLICVLTASVCSAEDPVVDMQTNVGTITLKLFPEKASITVTNFLNYVEQGFYEGTIFHRVIDGFVVQGGGFTDSLEQKETSAPISNEASNGLSNVRGTVAMARTNDPNSATSQFFINTNDNLNLDYVFGASAGYAVFGEVIEGIDIVDQISSVATENISGVQNIPSETITIESVRVRQAQLQFSNLQESYVPGETIFLSLLESGITRNLEMDLWVAVLMPDNQLFFLKDNSTVSASLTASPFKQGVKVADTRHSVLEFKVPAGWAGKYTFFAIYNEPGANINDLVHTLRSNLLQASTTLQN